MLSIQQSIGAKFITCDSQEYINFLISAVDDFESLWKNSNVAEILWGLVTSVWIPPLITEFKDIFMLVNKQKAGLSSGNCLMLHSFSKNSGTVLKVGKAGEAFPAKDSHSFHTNQAVVNKSSGLSLYDIKYRYLLVPGVQP